MQRVGVVQRVGSLFRRYRVPKHTLVLPRPYLRDDRGCYIAALPAEWVSDADGSSSIQLFEDGERLGPAHCAHDDIRTLGRGRYSHWGTSLFFSSSDNSSPNTNARIYSVLPPRGWTRRPAWREEAVRPPAAERQSDLDEDVEHCGAQVEPPTADERSSRVRIEPELIEHLEGQQYIAPAPASWPCDRTSVSTLVLLEGDDPLPTPHAPHREIETLGRGRYSHWNSQLRFSSSDGSDPRTSGRTYVMEYPDVLPFAHAPGRAVHDRGHCWILPHLPSHWPSDSESRSRLVLFEEGRPLGPAHASHEDVRALGRGHYSHWDGFLYFSTSDNSSPEENGRTYSLALADEDGAGNP